MGIKENWANYISITRTKGESHLKAGRYWSSVHNGLSMCLILLAGITTILALIDEVPRWVAVLFAALTCLFAIVAAFVRAGDKRSKQVDASKDFKILMLKMVRAESEREYEDLWKDLNLALADEPMVPKRYAAPIAIDFTMTPELLAVANEKEIELGEFNQVDEDEDVVVTVEEGDD